MIKPGRHQDDEDEGEEINESIIDGGPEGLEDGVAEQPSSLYDDDGNEIVDETGTPIADASDESQRGFLPLAKEAEIALLRLIEDGRISSNKQGAVSAILHNYL